LHLLDSRWRAHGKRQDVQVLQDIEKVLLPLVDDLVDGDGRCRLSEAVDGS
jgi:hypothetical protein